MQTFKTFRRKKKERWKSISLSSTKTQGLNELTNILQNPSLSTAVSAVTGPDTDLLLGTCLTLCFCKLEMRIICPATDIYRQ